MVTLEKDYCELLCSSWGYYPHSNTKVVYDLNHALANDDSATITIVLSVFDLRKLARCSHYVSGDYGSLYSLF